MDTFLAVIPLLAQEPTPEQIAQGCLREGQTEPGAICTAVYEATGARLLGILAGNVVPTILEIALIAVVAFVANRLARRAIGHFTRTVADEAVNKLSLRRPRGLLATTGPIDLRRATGRAETVGGVLRSVATVAIYGMAVVLILGALGIQLGPLIAGAGIIGVALGFGAQSLVKDFLSGIFILLEDQYGIGDVVDIGDAGNIMAGGVVEAITLRVTRVRDVQGTVWWVPNGEIRRIGNKSQLWARTLLDVGVAYDTDVGHATGVIKRVADELWHDEAWSDKILEEPEVWGVENFGPDQIVIRAVVKVEPGRQWAVNRELRARLLAAFDEEGIEIPFPQRTVWMRTHPEDGADGAAAVTGGVTPRKHRGNRVDTPST